MEEVGDVFDKEEVGDDFEEEMEKKAKKVEEKTLEQRHPTNP